MLVALTPEQELSEYMHTSSRTHVHIHICSLDFSLLKQLHVHVHTFHCVITAVIEVVIEGSISLQN